MPTEVYICDICRAKFNTLDKAQNCENDGVPTDIKVGDIIQRHDGYGWHTGPEHWIIRGDKTFHDKPIHDFYWVVVAATGHDQFSFGEHFHHNRLILATRGVVNGKSALGSDEWGVIEHRHYTRKRIGVDAVVVENPPALVRAEADAFLASHLFVRGYGNSWKVEKI